MVYLEWLVSFLIIIPLWLAGIIFVKKAITENRAEVIIPLGLIASVIIYIFLLNITSFLFKGIFGISVSLFLFLIAAFLLGFKDRSFKIDFPKGKILIFWIITLLFWGFYLYHPISHTIYWAEDNIYFSIGKTFAKGNFPILSPWQPDVSANYHYGGSIFLGAINAITGVHLDILRRLIPILLILSTIQLLIWGFKRHQSLITLAFYQLIPVIGFVTFGSFMITWPTFPLALPNLAEFPTIPSWLRQLPTLSQTPLDTYGMDSNLSLVIYHLHSGFGLAGFIFILFLSVFQNLKSKLFWLILGMSLAAMFLINESLAPAALICAFLLLFHRQNSKRILVSFFIFIGLIVLFQGGLATEGFNNSSQSVITITPPNQWLEKTNHFFAQTGHLLPFKNEWLPLRWYHLDLVWLFVITLFFLPVMKTFKNPPIFLIVVGFILSALFFSAVYYLVIPTYLPSDGNRFRASSYLFLGLAISLGVISLVNYLHDKKQYLKLFILSIITLWIILPSATSYAFNFIHLPYQQNFFFEPEYTNLPKVITWSDQNIKLTDRILDLAGYINYLTDNYQRFEYDGTAKPLAAYAGVFTPFWDGRFKDYTYSPGPDFINILHTLNPTSLKQLRISHLVIDQQYFQNLPKIRQSQINNPEYFEQVFIDRPIKDYWIAVYKINQNYLSDAFDLPDLHTLDQLIPQQAEVYIDKTSTPFSWLQLRTAVTFILKDRSPWIQPGEGGYNGHLAVKIPTRIQTPNQKYEYLILKKETNPNTVCNCLVQSIWSGFNEKLVVWKILEYVQ